MKEIPLSRGKVALVDDEWYPILSRWKWYWSSNGYAMRDIGGREKKQHIFMHRYITMAPEEWPVDHINGNRLDNRWGNLRIATPSKNQQNKAIQRNNTTGYKGVAFDKSRGKYMASISFEYKQRNLGRFDTAEEAARAYNRAARELHGVFARLNEVPDE